jgi:deoxyhypusine monooxygenase
MGASKNIPEVSEYGSVDPAPPFDETDLSILKSMLLDENLRMFERMRAIFSLRNNRSLKAIEILCNAFQSTSALLRHEIAYVLGQMQDSSAVPTLIDILSDELEHIMVRHEAAEALGAIGDTSAKPILEKYLFDSNPEISESCEVALDLMSICKNRIENGWE